MDEAVELRLKTVLSNILSVPQESISDDSSPDTIEKWDSVSHMNVVLALEEEFDISFSDVQIVEMLNYGLIRETMKELGVS